MNKLAMIIKKINSVQVEGKYQESAKVNVLEFYVKHDHKLVYVTEEAIQDFDLMYAAINMPDNQYNKLTEIIRQP